MEIKMIQFSDLIKFYLCQNQMNMYMYMKCNYW